MVINATRYISITLCVNFLKFFNCSFRLGNDLRFVGSKVKVTVTCLTHFSQKKLYVNHYKSSWHMLNDNEFIAFYWLKVNFTIINQKLGKGGEIGLCRLFFYNQRTETRKSMKTLLMPRWNKMAAVPRLGFKSCVSNKQEAPPFFDAVSH